MLARLTLSVFVGLLSYVAYRLVTTYQYFMPIPLSFPASYFNLNGRNGTCHVIHDTSDRMRMCEDLHEWADSDGSMIGLLVSCDTGRREWNTVVGPMKDPNPRGDIWFVETSTERAVHLPLNGFPDGHDFHPLGISVLHSAGSDTAWVAVVNHGRHNSTLEVFDLTRPTLSTPPILSYRRTLTHRSFVSPNAVYLLSPTSALFSQDHMLTRRLPSPWGNILPYAESFLSVPRGWVDYIDFSGAEPTITRAISWIPMANGIAVSQERHEVAVSASTGLSVRFYSFSGDSPLPRSLKYKRTVDLPFSPDNLFFSRSGTLYAAGHRTFAYVARMARHPEFHAPSWIVAIDDDEFRTVYQSIGAGDEGAFGASTTGVVDNKEQKLWASGLYETGVLSCAL